jgi:PLP dependent protein
MTSLDIAGIQHRLETLWAELPDNVTLVVATKYLPAEALPALYELGIRHFGESRVQDALLKQAWLGPEKAAAITWHMIGHLQQNKVNKTLGTPETGPVFDLIHSVDSLALAEKLSLAHAKQGWVQPILLQVNVTQEPQKYGLGIDEVSRVYETCLALPGIAVRGLMCFGHSLEGSEGKDPAACEAVFSCLQALGTQLEETFGGSALELSMGMSFDYGHALKNGATIIRIGRMLLGE